MNEKPRGRDMYEMSETGEGVGTRERALAILDNEALGVVWIVDTRGTSSYGSSILGHSVPLAALEEAVRDWLDYIVSLGRRPPV